MVPIPHDDNGNPDLSNREILYILQMVFADWLHEIQSHKRKLKREICIRVSQETLVSLPNI